MIVRDERVCVAQIGAPHGLRGDVRLKAFTDDPMALSQYGILESEDGGSNFEIEALREGKDVLIARFHGVGDRTQAESLRNTRLYVPRARLPAVEDSETYYHADLIGLSVVGVDGKALGIITAVHNFGAGDLIEVLPQEGAPTLLLPFTKTIVPDVDLAAGRAVVDPPTDAGDSAEQADGVS